MMITLPMTRPLASTLPGSAGWGHPRPHPDTAQLGLVAGDGGCVRPRPMPPHNCWDPREWGVKITPASFTTEAAAQAAKAAGMAVEGGRTIQLPSPDSPIQ